jgi:coenzyme F420-reducing hydrogenase alpha subunit
MYFLKQSLQGHNTTVNKTIELIRSTFYWKTTFATVENNYRAFDPSLHCSFFQRVNIMIL